MALIPPKMNKISHILTRKIVFTQKPKKLSGRK